MGKADISRWTGRPSNEIEKGGPFSTVSLDYMRRVGHKRLIVRCLDSGCGRWRALPLDDLIVRFGPGASISKLEPRFRCRVCDYLGARLEPEPRD